MRETNTNSKLELELENEKSFKKKGQLKHATPAPHEENGKEERYKAACSIIMR